MTYSRSNMTTSTGPLRAGIYARISVHDRNIPKVENQIRDCQTLCDRLGYTVHDTYADDGIAASRGELRPDWERLLADLDAGHLDVIVATEPERMYRNNLETSLLNLACTAARATYYTVRGGPVDPSTAGGEFQSVMFGAFGAMESKRKAERQRAANASRRTAGLASTTCPVPFGYNQDRVSLCQPQAELIRTGTRAITSGATLNSVVAMWQKSGIKPPRANQWGRISVKNILTRWRNAGIVSERDIPIYDITAQWESIVSRDELEKCRLILSSKIGEQRKASRLCSGIARCACGDYMIVTGAPKYYMCASRIKKTGKPGQIHTGIKCETLDAMVRKALVYEYTTESDAGATTDTDGIELAKLHDDLGKNAKSLSALLDLLLDEKVTRETYNEKFRALTSDKTKLERQREMIANRSAHTQMLTRARELMFENGEFEKTGDVATELGQRFDAMSLEEQRRLIAATFDIRVSPGRAKTRVYIHPLNRKQPQKPMRYRNPESNPLYNGYGIE